jgi:hypothetical protein
VAKALRIATHPDGADPAAALAEAMSALDKAAKSGAIHRNAAARRKSRLALKVNSALGGAPVQSPGHVSKTTGRGAAAKAAKARVAASKATKAKGAQTAAGKARAALSKTARADAAERSAGSTTAKADAPSRASATTTRSSAAKSSRSAPKASEPKAATKTRKKAEG